MRSPVRALIWEQWRQVWWIAPVGIVFTGAFSLALHQDPDIGWFPDLWWVGSTASILGSLALAGGLLLFMHSSPTDVRAGIPARHRTLPVRTTTLVISQYVFRLGFVVALTAALTGIASLIDARYGPAVLPSVVVAACIMSLAMAAMWSIGKQSIGLAALLVVAISIIANIAFAWADHNVPYAAPAIPAAIIIASSIIAIRGAAHVSDGAGGITRRENIVRPTPQIAVKRTAIQAQAWLDARRRSHVVWVLAALFFSLVFSFVAFRWWSDLKYSSQYGGPSARYTAAENLFECAQILIWFPPVVAFASSICFVMLDIRDATLRMANFLFTRPIRSCDFVRARCRFGMRAALYLCVPSLILSCGLAAAGSALDATDNPNVLEFFLSHEFLLACVLSFAATALLFWSAFPALAASVWVLIAAMTDLVDQLHPELVFAAIPAAILIVAVARAVRAYRNGTWPRRFVPLAFGMALLFWLGTLYLETMAPMQRDDEVLFAASAISALALYVLFSQPIWIDFLRHGGLSRAGQRPPKEA